jgi:hypothetical protein
MDNKIHYCVLGVGGMKTTIIIFIAVETYQFLLHIYLNFTCNVKS